MPLTTSTGSSILRPEEVAELLIRPMVAMSVAAEISTVVPTSSTSYRIPYVATDPVAAWVAEGDEITPSDADLDEVNVVPTKVAGLSVISRELADDSSPEAAQVVGQGLSRDIARRVDQAYLGALAAPAPSGLGALVGFTPIAAPAAWADADPFTEAQFAAEDEFATITSWVAHRDDAEALANLKEATDSTRPLLQPDVTRPGRRVIGGVPLYTSPYATPGVVWGIPEDRVHVVIRDDATIESDRSVFFTSDRVAVKGTMRVGFGFAHPAALVKISLTP